MAVNAYGELFFRYLVFNVKTALHYRVSFISQIVFMGLNNVVFLLFWWIFFSNFEEVGGWQLENLYILYAIVVIAFGLAQVFFGNVQNISRIITEGELDSYLVQPKDPLLHISIGKIFISGIGDIVSGIVLLILFLDISPLRFLFVGVLCVCSSILFACYGVILGALTFFLGRSSELHFQLQNALIAFSTYPGSLFEGAVRVLLHTIIPAAFVGYIPLQLMQRFQVELFVMYLGVVFGFLLLAAGVFRRGLRRYESGNLMGARL